MNHPEADYINAGARYQLAKTPAQTIAQAGMLRRMIESRLTLGRTKAAGQRPSPPLANWATCLDAIEAAITRMT